MLMLMTTMTVVVTMIPISNDNSDDNADCDDDHLSVSHCCVHPTSRFSARREPSLRTAPTTVDGLLAVDTGGEIVKEEGVEGGVLLVYDFELYF